MELRIAGAVAGLALVAASATACAAGGASAPSVKTPAPVVTQTVTKAAPTPKASTPTAVQTGTAPIDALTYSCTVADNASNTEYTGMTVLNFTVKVHNPASQASSNLPEVQIYVQDYSGAAEQGPYPFPVGHDIPPGTSTLTFRMNSYAAVDLCSAT